MANRAATITEADLNRAFKVAAAHGTCLTAYEYVDKAGGTHRLLFGQGASAALGSTLEERAEASAQARRMARRRG